MLHKAVKNLCKAYLCSWNIQVRLRASIDVGGLQAQLQNYLEIFFKKLTLTITDYFLIIPVILQSSSCVQLCKSPLVKISLVLQPPLLCIYHQCKKFSNLVNSRTIVSCKLMQELKSFLSISSQNSQQLVVNLELLHFSVLGEHY